MNTKLERGKPVTFYADPDTIKLIEKLQEKSQTICKALKWYIERQKEEKK